MGLWSVCRKSAPILLPLLTVCVALWVYELGWGWTLQGGLARLCFDILEFSYDNGGSLYLAVPFVRGYWVGSCRSVFAELDGKQRTVLEALFDKPLPLDVLHPAMTLARYGVANYPVPEDRKRAQRKLLLESPPREQSPQGPDRENLTRQVLAHAVGKSLDWLEKHAAFDVLGRPSQEPIVEPSEVGTALKEGRLVRFDATKILPAQTFNVTLDKLAQMHAPDGDSISILAFLHEFKECRSKAHSHRKHFPVGALFCPPPPTLGEMRRSFPDPKLMPMASRIALRRLPRYIDEDKMLKDLGLEGVERPEGQIIMGHAMGDTHWDEQDNLFIQASGVSVVFGVPAEYSDAIGGDEKWCAKNSGMEWDDWLKADDVRRTAIPWYYMVLKPGDAIAIPSRSFHAVYGSHNRASLQTFLEPKFHGMRWDTNKDSYWHKETDARQAVRNLYFKTLGHLWDSRKIGMVAQGGIIEYL